MKNISFKILSAIVLTGFLTLGCDKSKDNPNQAMPDAKQDQASPTAPTEKPPEAKLDQIKCQKGNAFAAPMGPALSEGQLLNSVLGIYELDEVHMYHKATTLDGKYIGAFNTVASRYIGNSTIMGVTNIRETSLNYECHEESKDSKIPFLTEVRILVATIVHSPSGRITTFDRGGQTDNPEFNTPSFSEVYFDSVGAAHYTNYVGISGPPYVSDRYLSDVLKKYSSTPKIYARANGTFEMRISWNEQKNLPSGKSFKTETDVVISYKKWK